MHAKMISTRLGEEVKKSVYILRTETGTSPFVVVVLSRKRINWSKTLIYCSFHLISTRRLRTGKARQDKKWQE